MKKLLHHLTILTFIFLSLLYPKAVRAEDYFKQGDTNFYKATISMSQDERNYYLNKALSEYQKEYDKNPQNIKAIISLGKTYCLLNDRTNAKSTLMHGYNLYQDNPYIQASLGDYNFYFQEYATALEFYKLALASGLLKDYKTNLITGLCFEKLGDEKNAYLYYQICLLLNKNSNVVKNRIHNLLYKDEQPLGKSELVIFESEELNDPEIYKSIEMSKDFR